VEDRYEPLENAYDHKARLYNEYDEKYSETLQYKFWLKYVPNFTDGKDYLINGEASITSILNSTFSLKVAYKGMYDNSPAKSGFKNYDYLTTTSLVAKF
jgi:putative salt-induced outer membrane protein YdiY